MTDEEKTVFIGFMTKAKHACFGSLTAREEIHDLVRTMEQADQDAFVIGCISLLSVVAHIGTGRAREAARMAFDALGASALEYKAAQQNGWDA